MIDKTNFSALLFLLTLFFSGPLQAVTFQEVFESALKNTATIRTQDLAVSIAEEEKTKAQAIVLPRIGAESVNVWRDQADVGPFGEAYQHSAALTLNQPLFQGGSEFYAWTIAKNLPQVAKLERENQRRQLYAQVAIAFYQSFRLQRDRALYLEQEKALRDIVKTLQRRAKIGRSKPTDVLAAQSQLARIAAERANVERLFLQSENQLKNLAGIRRIEALHDPLSAEQLNFNPSWSTRIEETPQILASELAVKNAKEEIGVARGTYVPSVDANANYYLDRAGILRDSEWDVTVTARWELYNGGSDSSEVRIKRLQLQQMQARLADIKRNQNNEFEALKNQFFALTKAVKQFESAVALAKKNYEQHLKEASQGLVSELEALRILDDFLQIRRTYEQQMVESKITWLQMKALVGELQ